MALAEAGRSVLLIESGDELPNHTSGELSRAEVRTDRTHAPVEIASCRAFGGTSWWWGGRCVPFDAADFEEREYAPGTEWPICYDEIRAWHKKTAEFFSLSSDEFRKDAVGWSTLRQVSCDQLERWTPHVNLNTVYFERLKSSNSIVLILGATLTELRVSEENGRVHAITLADRAFRKTINVKTCILACGGLETTRLMLLLARSHPEYLRSWAAVVGKFYMGHISGKIADLILNQPKMIDELDFFREGDHFARRRFTLQDDVLRNHRLLNIAFWADNAPFHDAKHGNGLLSLVWLLLAVPFVGRRLLSEGVRISHVGPPRFMCSLTFLMSLRPLLQ
ncbi:hypothetical protein ACVOMS_31585 [Bradyrhizobium guangxiense]